MLPKGSRKFLGLGEGWCKPDVLDYLYEHAWAQRNLPALNIGCYKGLSCSAIAMANPVVCCVDMFEPTKSTPEVDPVSTIGRWAENMHALGLRERIKLFVMPSSEALDLLYEAAQKFGFIFIDGGHEYDVVSNDIRVSGCLVAPGGEIVLDDVNLDSNHPGVRKAMNEIGGFKDIPGTQLASKRF